MYVKHQQLDYFDLFFLLISFFAFVSVFRRAGNCMLEPQGPFIAWKYEPFFASKPLVRRMVFPARNFRELPAEPGTF